MLNEQSTYMLDTADFWYWYPEVSDRRDMESINSANISWWLVKRCYVYLISHLWSAMSSVEPKWHVHGWKNAQPTKHIDITASCKTRVSVLLEKAVPRGQH